MKSEKQRLHLEKLRKINIQRANGWIIKRCLKCNEEFRSRKDSYRKFCSKECYDITGSNNPKWRGGKIKVDGYIYIYKKEHPNATQDGYVCEHRLIMENELKRYLFKGEIVHHINGIRTDNRIENLKLLTNSEHSSYHTNKKIEDGTYNYPNGRRKDV